MQVSETSAGHLSSFGAGWSHGWPCYVWTHQGSPCTFLIHV